MLVGYNTNISYKEKTYHIQTEDSGKSNPVIVTLLYAQGAILASKKTSYEQFVGDPDFKDKVSKIMKVQHRVMIKELLSGKYTGGYQEETEEAPKDDPVKEAAGTQMSEGVPEKSDEPEKKEQALAAEAPSEEQEQGKKQITNSLDDILLNYIMKRAK
jgi:hypothetical protein